MEHTAEAAHAPTHAPHGIGAIRLHSISHRTAALGDLECMALSGAAQAALRQSLRAAGIHAVVLCTCNRTELYWHSARPADDAAAEEALLACAPAGTAPPREAFASVRGLAAARHLFRVAAGLESLVVGESEVLGQMRDAIDAAERDETAGFFLSGLFRAALRFGGRARSETGIGAGALSIASAAVQLLARVHEDLTRCTVLVVGAGMTGLKAARHLRAERVGTLVLMNRTMQRASEAAAELEAHAAPLEDLAYWLARADAVVAAVQVDAPIVTAELLRSVRPMRRAPTLALLDLSLPRAIDPACGAIGGVAHRDLSGLEQIVAHNRARREREIPRVEALLEHEIEVFEGQARESAVRPLVAELRQRAEIIRREEMQRALQNGAHDAQALDRVTRRLVDRLLHAPSQALRGGELALDPQHTLYLRSLFGLHGGIGDGHPGTNGGGHPGGNGHGGV
jgi:glutamyl-tRNA reductase